MPIDWFPLWLSLRVATLATMLAIIMGLWLAWVLANREFRWKEILDAAITLPLVLPPTVLGFYILVAIQPRSLLGALHLAESAVAGIKVPGTTRAPVSVPPKWNTAG